MVGDRRLQTAVMAVIAGIVLIIVLRFTLPQISEHWAKTLLDYAPGTDAKTTSRFPFSVQCFMWIAFCLGLGELYARYKTAIAEARQLNMKYLPEDERTVLVAEDLGGIYRKVQEHGDAKDHFLPRLLNRCILQFQASLSIDQSASLLNTSVEMFIHEVDLRYNMLRYICWVIPSLGFIGTVIGIGSALEYAGAPENSAAQDLLNTVTGKLAVSFEGTFLALVLASILVLLQNVIQSKEEHSLNLAAQYCLDNLINRLYVPNEPSAKRLSL
jgi:biopolymer transport protein ExbB/TolQ